MSILFGKRILITRPPPYAQAFAQKLLALGAIPVLLPMIAIEPVDPTSLQDADGYDWIVFTSANAVEPVAKYGLTQFGKVAAVGTATAQALHTQGIQVDLVPETHSAEALFEAMRDSMRLEGLKILLPQGNLANPSLGERLRQAGAWVDEVVVYKTIHPPVDIEILRLPCDIVTFTSPSTVQHFVGLFEDVLAVLGAARVAVIGPVTATAAREAGLPVHIMAAPQTSDGLIDAIMQNFQRSVL